MVLTIVVFFDTILAVNTSAVLHIFRHGILVCVVLSQVQCRSQMLNSIILLVQLATAGIILAKLLHEAMPIASTTVTGGSLWRLVLLLLGVDGSCWLLIVIY